jgi:hypothetical protein
MIRLLKANSTIAPKFGTDTARNIAVRLKIMLSCN